MLPDKHLDYSKSRICVLSWCFVCGSCCWSVEIFISARYRQAFCSVLNYVFNYTKYSLKIKIKWKKVTARMEPRSIVVEDFLFLFIHFVAGLSSRSSGIVSFQRLSDGKPCWVFSLQWLHFFLASAFVRFPLIYWCHYTRSLARRDADKGACRTIEAKKQEAHGFPITKAVAWNNGMKGCLLLCVRKGSQAEAPGSEQENMMFPLARWLM